MQIKKIIRGGFAMALMMVMAFGALSLNQAQAAGSGDPCGGLAPSCGYVYDSDVDCCFARSSSLSCTPVCW